MFIKLTLDQEQSLSHVGTNMVVLSLHHNYVTASDFLTNLADTSTAEKRVVVIVRKLVMNNSDNRSLNKSKTRPGQLQLSQDEKMNFLHMDTERTCA